VTDCTIPAPEDHTVIAAYKVKKTGSHIHLASSHDQDCAAPENERFFCDLAPDLQEALLFLPPTLRGRDAIILADVQAIAAAFDWWQATTIVATTLFDLS
jgi:hypothetical protein